MQKLFTNILKQITIFPRMINRKTIDQEIFFQQILFKKLITGKSQCFGSTLWEASWIRSQEVISGRTKTGS